VEEDMAFERKQGLALVAAAALLLGWAPSADAGCTKDTDCKGDRICDTQGQCVDPQPCPPCDCEEQAEPPEEAREPAPPVRPTVPDGTTLLITMTDGSPTTGVEVSCPGGFRLRISLEAGVATVPGVPAEHCSVHFKGPVNARFSPVRGGQSLLCYIQGSTAVCE
jgi:hypothetical protein